MSKPVSPVAREFIRKLRNGQPRDATWFDVAEAYDCGRRSNRVILKRQRYDWCPCRVCGRYMLEYWRDRVQCRRCYWSMDLFTAAIFKAIRKDEMEINERMPPALAELFGLLPDPPNRMTTEDRRKWLAALAVVLELIYPEDYPMTPVDPTADWSNRDSAVHQASAPTA